MSSPIKIAFVRNDEIVGIGHGNLGIGGSDDKIPTAIFDAWHQAVEYFDPSRECPERMFRVFADRYGHMFDTREALFEYQFAIIPSHRLIIRRSLVHDLLMQRITTPMFCSMITDDSFQMSDEVWETLCANTEKRSAAKIK